ncbi:MAG: cation-translocating P-type ATPase [Bdellovibrionia bacterium]
MPQQNIPTARRITWVQKSPAQVLKEHQCSLEKGLSSNEVLSRRVRFGENCLEESRKMTVWRIWISQFRHFLVLILIFASVLASFLGDIQDSLVILSLVFLNAVLGFFQEYRAERTLDSLRVLAEPRARVRRDGNVKMISSRELVPGDLVFLEAGNCVPADLRLMECHQLRTNESMLTGESQPVDKRCESIEVLDLPVSDQQNMDFQGTLVSSGRALGLVVSTGMDTELGQVALLLEKPSEIQTPLGRKLGAFARFLVFGVGGLCFFIFTLGILRGEKPGLMLMTALSLAVAAIPEALPAVISATLAVGARAMSQKKAVIRQLSAVETLGSVTFIGSDKTGTLTENRMAVEGFFFRGSFRSQISNDVLSETDGRALTQILALNQDVTVGENGELLGDPTETALVQALREMGIHEENLQKQFPRVGEIPFTPERGMMSTFHRLSSDELLLLVKGAPEKVLPLCDETLSAQGKQAFCSSHILGCAEQMAVQGFRVLALAHRSSSIEDLNRSPAEVESHLRFVGLVALMDPPRKKTKEVIEVCHQAGIRIVMMTGDHPHTAQAIAQKLGISSSASELITGAELRSLSDEALQRRVLQISVYARVTPDQKIRIIEALKKKGQIVAMTGDGINDAPALQGADIGVAMGLSGTDVARQAAHVVLLDDQLETLVAAVSEGRRIYDNIRKFIRFALSGNSGEVWTLFFAPFLGLPLPLTPIQILWVNLVTDGLPGLALAFEPESSLIMRRKPRDPQEQILSRGLGVHALWVGLLTAASTLGVARWAYSMENPHWQSMGFTVLTWVQMGHVLAIRSEEKSFFQLRFNSNPMLLFAVTLTFTLQTAALFWGPLSRFLKTTPLSFSEMMICFLASSTVFLSVEGEKLWVRLRAKQKLG